MARNAAEQGFPITAYNRSNRETDLGQVTLVGTVEEAVRDADVVCVMVSDGPAVKDVLLGSGNAVEYMREGAKVINMSTIGVTETRDLALALTNLGYEWMDAPVSGSVGPARDGTLVFLVGGLEATYERMRPFFLSMGKEAFHLGPVGSGAGMKLLVNAFLGATVEAVSECMAVADKAGLDAVRYLDVLSTTGMWSPLLAGKSSLWKKDEYPQSFALKHMAKDLSLMSQFGTSVSAATPTLGSVTQVYLAALAGDLAELDMSGVFRETTRMAGSNPSRSS